MDITWDQPMIAKSCLEKSYVMRLPSFIQR